jgi:hypothetical protein
MAAILTRRNFCILGAAPLVAALPGCLYPNLGTAAPAKWAAIALRAAALGPPGLPPFISSRAYAMAFLAAHNALQAIFPVYDSYMAGPPVPGAPGANADAAVAAAVRDVLVRELPFAAEMLDTEYSQTLTSIPGDGSRSLGVALGQQCASIMLNERVNDGLAQSEGPFTEGSLPGEYRFTPPFDFAAAVHFGEVRPFSINNGASFRAPAPYAVTDAAYAADFNEVKVLGVAEGSIRTTEQSEIGRFWLENTPDSWMSVALQVASSRYFSGWDLMRALALIQMAQTDAYIACLESKYYYKFWRPITAIRLGDGDGNPATVGDTSWTSFDPVCPPIPDYPSGHSAAAGAGATTLAAIFGSDSATFSHESATLPGATRNFHGFSQMGQEIADSRVYVGYHFRLATTVGLQQGRTVAQQVLATQLPRRRSMPKPHAANGQSW